MKKYSRILASIISIILVAMTFSACGTKKSDAPKTSETKKAAEKMELTFFYPVQVGGPLTALIDKITADFMAENPNIVIKPVYTGNYDDTVVKIQTAIQGKNPPDFFVSLATQIYSMVAMDAVIPLDDLIAKDGGKEYVNDFLPGFMLDSFYDGKIWSIPFQRSTEIIYYNKDAFREAGLDPEKPPKTWDELIEYSKKLVKKDASGNVDRWGVGIALNSGSAQWTFTGFALQNSENGENLMSDDGKKVLFDTPGNVEALQLWTDLQKKYKVMPEGIIQWADLPSAFIDGKFGMIYHTTGNLANISKNAKFEFGTAFLPGNKRPGAPTGGGNFYISKDIPKEKQEAAWKFIRFATQPERVAKWNVDTGYVATRQSAFETDIIKKYYETLPQAKVAKDQLKFAKQELTTYDAAKIWRILNDNIQSAITGKATPAEALANAQKQATESLAKYQK